MHTFFINTSKKELSNYKDILEIQHENRMLVSLACPFEAWHKEDNGYKACVRKMGEMIDSYKDINNQYNLIIYVDLLDFAAYTSIPYVREKERERQACLQAMYMLCRHYVHETLFNELVDCGRVPNETLIIFEQNEKRGEETLGKTEKDMKLMGSELMKLLGLPSIDVVETIAVKHLGAGAGGGMEEFAREIAETKAGAFLDGLEKYYHVQLDVWMQEIKALNSVAKASQVFANSIMGCDDYEKNDIKHISFATNRRAGSVNKQECAKRDLRLFFYLLDCVQDETIFKTNRSIDYPGQDSCIVKRFPEIKDWNQVVSAFEAKRSIYERKYKETVSLSDRYTKLKLAPELYAFDHDRFGLDEFGKKRKKFEIVDVKPNSTSEENDSQEETDGTILPEADKKAVVISEAEASSLFSSDEYKCFPYRGEKGAAEGIKANTPPEKMISEAQKLREHHIHYLKKLKIHISDILSNYAGRSVENDPALLQKRRVSIGDEDFEDASKEYRYAKVGRPAEEKKLKAVKDISDSAYETAVLEYLRFSAGRSVAVTDIEEQCDWFVTRIHQITESLRKIRTVAVGLFAAIFVIYIPFVVIQWEAITENFLTLITALASVGVPVVLLYVVFTAAAIMQRKKYLEAWREFEAQSDQVLLDNSIAAEKYDKLLHTFIPSLRWIYEYRLDVEFYSSCCKMARAKLNHHIQKLHDRVTAVGNILEDLEYKTSPEKYEGVTFDEIDYNVSFCTGDNNCNFYSIIDQHILDMIMK